MLKSFIEERGFGPANFHDKMIYMSIVNFFAGQ
jgi:hypothetical protein